MSLETHEKFEAVRPDETERFPLKEAKIAFADERSYEASPPHSYNFDRFIKKHQATHRIWVEGDYLFVTRYAIAS